MLTQRGAKPYFQIFSYGETKIFLAKGGPWPNALPKYATAPQIHHYAVFKVCPSCLQLSLFLCTSNVIWNYKSNQIKLRLFTSVSVEVRSCVRWQLREFCWLGCSDTLGSLRVSCDFWDESSEDTIGPADPISVKWIPAPLLLCFVKICRLHGFLLQIYYIADFFSILFYSTLSSDWTFQLKNPHFFDYNTWTRFWCLEVQIPWHNDLLKLWKFGCRRPLWKWNLSAHCAPAAFLPVFREHMDSIFVINDPYLWATEIKFIKILSMAILYIVYT